MTEQNQPSYFTKYRLPVLLLFIITTLGILAGTLLPPNYDLPDTIWKQDKVGHFIMFLIWTTLFGAFLAVKNQARPKLLAVFLYSAAYGLGIEILQLLLPTNRQAETLDFVADISGSLVAICILWFIFKKAFPATS